MRLSAAAIVLGAAFLLLSGLRSGALPFTPNARFSDAATSHWPAALWLRQSVLERGTFPLWRDTIMAGQPFAANPLNKTAYPLQWLALLFPPALHLDLMIVLHLLLAGWSMYRWTRSLGLRRDAAALSALSYGLAPRVVGHLGAGHLDLLYALAWWPFLMESVRRLVAAPSPRNAVLLALFAALVLTADVRLSLFAFITAAAYGLYELWTNRAAPQTAAADAVGEGLKSSIAATPTTTLYHPRRLFAYLVLAAFVLLTLTAALTVPFLAWRPYLSRATITQADAGVFSLEAGQFLGLLLPAHAGNIESLTYLGLPVIVLALVGLAAYPRRLAFWGIVALLSAWYALGANGVLWPLLVRLVPGLLWFRVPSRAWFVVVLVAPLLAGYGLDALLTLIDNQRSLHSSPVLRARLLVLGGLGASLACGGFSLLSLPLPRSVGLSVLLVGAALALILLLALSGRISPQRLAPVLLVLTFADLAWTGVHWLEWRTDDAWLSPYTTLATRLVDDGAARVYSPSYSLPQEVAAAYQLRLFGGVDPFQLAGIVDAIRQGSGVQSEGYSVVQPPLMGAAGDDLSQANHDAVPDTRVLAQWGISHVASAYPMDSDRLNLIDTINGVSIYANLDYATPILNPQGWPDASRNLPDDATVTRLNQLTLVSYVISTFALALCLALLVAMHLRIRHPAS
jgi:hypothetical protein